MRSLRIVVITGLSGAGKSTALHAFEDLGYFCIDNLPPPLLSKFIESCDQPYTEINKICVGMDVRERHFLDEMLPVIEELRRREYEIEVVFFQASPQALLNRFKESRRQHPLGSGGRTAAEAIAAERELLAPIEEHADKGVDTTAFTTHKLREWVVDNFGAGREMGEMVLSLVSFGYRGGIPPEADLVFDVRFIANPYFVEGLKARDGRDEAVYRYVVENEATQAFLRRLQDMLEYLLPVYAAEGKSYLTIAFGCTGGQHRSVAVVRWAEQWLLEKGHALRVIHRDLPSL